MINNKLTYVSIFSSAGVGCFGFKQEDYMCIATNELIERRLKIQEYNKKCKFQSGYICGDIAKKETKKKIFKEINRYKKLGNDSVDVLIATPPCQGMSIANHKKKKNEIKRNSLVVESIILTKKIKPRFFVFENVQAFLNTGCTSTDGTIQKIETVIDKELSDTYQIMSKIINFKNYGNKSSRTRTLVIGVRHDYSEYISPIELFPDYTNECTLKETIGMLEPLRWGEINKNDILHAFRIYPEEMRTWISELKEGQSAFDNKNKDARPHKMVNGKIVENVNKNGNKYTRQYWNKVAPCIHTRNDQLASQNTIHPVEDRVFSIRELMLMMTIPASFKWCESGYKTLNSMDENEKKAFYKQHEINIRQSIGEAVPTAIFRQIAHKIKNSLLANNFKLNIEKTINDYELNNINNLLKFIEKNPKKYSPAILSKIAEMANGKRTENDAYYTNKTLLNSIYLQMPDFNKDAIDILEPSVGVGNFLPYIFKKYENYKQVNLDVLDIDNNSLKITKALLKKFKKSNNIKIHYINANFLNKQFDKKYDLIIGNPPFTKINREYLMGLNEKYEYNANNLCALFLEKSLRLSSYVILIQPKYILNTSDFSITRDNLSKYKIDAILDFGEKGFKGVLIETICIFINSSARPNNTYIKNITLNHVNIIPQKTLTSKKYPCWLLYRDDFFNEVEKKLVFDQFTVFRDRQITNDDLSSTKGKNKIRVIKSRNISSKGKIVNIKNYDSYISLSKVKKKAVFKYYNNENVYLVPNMTYYPRMIENKKNTTVNGSVAILIPKNDLLTKKQIKYFSSREFTKFYSIARNKQTRSLNIDDTSVYFFGVLK